eukprot:g16076.t1
MSVQKLAGQQSFWESLSKVEANYLKSLLEAASLFQLQLEESEQAADASNAAQRELRRLQDTHADASASHAPQLQALQERRGELKREEALVASELSELSVQVQDVRNRLCSAQRSCQQRRQDLDQLKDRCSREKLHLKKLHSEDTAALENIRGESSQIADELGKEVTALKSAHLLVQQRHQEALLQRDEAAAELAQRLQEGHALRDLCSQAHRENSQLSAELRILDNEVEELVDTTDSEVEWELSELQQRCTALERQCARNILPNDRLSECMHVSACQAKDLSFAESASPCGGRRAQEDWMDFQEVEAQQPVEGVQLPSSCSPTPRSPLLSEMPQTPSKEKSDENLDSFVLEHRVEDVHIARRPRTPRRSMRKKM